MITQSAKDALPINVLDYCTDATQLAAVQSGNVGIDIPMNLALTAAKAAGRPVFIPGRNANGSAATYVTTANAAIINPGVTVFGNDATIKKVGTGALFQTKAADPVMTHGRLSLNAAKGATSVTLTSDEISAAGLLVGDWVVINDRKTIYSSANSYRAEFQLIQDISGDVVTFWSPLLYNYTAGAVSGGYARLLKPTLLPKVTYRDLNIIMDSGLNLPTGSSYHAFDNRWLLNGVFDNIRIEQLLNSGIHLQNCLNCSISNLDLNRGGSATSGTSNPASSEGRPGFSYGVCEAGLNLGLRVTGVTASSLRHLYTTVSIAPATGEPPSADYGEPVGTIVSDCIHNGPLNAGFDTHEAGQNISFHDCKVVGGHFVGLQIRAKGTTVRNFEVHDTIGAAVWIRGGEANNAYADLTVVNGVVADRTNLGVSFDATAWQDKGAIIDEAPRTRISNVNARFVGGPALELYRNAPFAGGKYSQIDVFDPCQVTTSETNVVVLRQLNAASTLNFDNLSSESSDGKVTDLIKILATTGTVRLRNIDGRGHGGKMVSAAPGVTVDTSVTVQRFDSQAQYIRHYSDATGHFAQSFSPSPASPKNFIIDVKTDAANSSPTGSLQFYAQVNGVKGIGSDQNGRILQQGAVIFDANRLPQIRAYGVASLPSVAATGTLAFASNGRAYNGAGVLENAGAGSGVLVCRNGGVWKIVGTNQTVSA